jgi:hypothetical protein
MPQNANAGGALTTANASSASTDAADATAGRRGLRRAQAAAGNAPVSDAARIAALIIGSPEFQRQ